MSTHKHIDIICLVAAILALVLCAVFMSGEALGIQAAPKMMGYENRLFDTSKVHTIDIVIDDWEGFLETARSEEYSACSVIIDGEAVNNVGIRGKGNTSLSSVASMDSDRYSFKIEFDQYDSTKTYHGLDKLSLNNVIQDNTCMKDYLSYQMMNEFGVPAPLCSYVWITVNGEDWGLYLAVEAVEESFLQRNYGNDYGELYKPDSMNMGGGRGNGKDFAMSEFMGQQENADVSSGAAQSDETQKGGNRGNMPVPGGFASAGGRPNPGEGFDPANMPDMGGIGGFDTGSSGVKLQYIDDDPASYSTIFKSAKTDITDADQERLIASLKQLSTYENLSEVVNVDDVLRYFVVHNYVVNGDSYTGSMIHNYYLYEENGRLSMIPWDYNLAFGTFMGGNGSSSVNDDIDEVLSDRPMQAWIFSDETYSQQYYALYAELLEQVDIQAIMDHAYQLIAPYIEKDPTAFCTYEEFVTGVETLKEFCTLRSESVRLQLAGSGETVDADTLNVSAMGSMGGGMGDFGNRGNSNFGPETSDEAAPQQGRMQFPDDMQMPDSMQFPGNPGATESQTSQRAESSEPTENTQSNSFGGFGNFSPPGEMPDIGNMGGFNGTTGNGQGSAANTSTLILHAVSVLFLAVGLFIAFRFKR